MNKSIYSIFMLIVILTTYSCKKEMRQSPQLNSPELTSTGSTVDKIPPNRLTLDGVYFNKCTNEDIHYSGTEVYRGVWLYQRNGRVLFNYEWHLEQVTG